MFTDRQCVPVDAAAVVALGLRSLGFEVTEQQVSDQSITTIAQTCAADDKARREALKAYIVLLLAIVMHPDVWTVQPAQLPNYVARFGPSWYHKALESAQRQVKAEAASLELDRELEHGRVILRIEGHLEDSSSLSRGRFLISPENAAGILHMLERYGYKVDLNKIGGHSIEEVAQICEPDDPIQRRLLQFAVENQLTILPLL